MNTNHDRFLGVGRNADVQFTDGLLAFVVGVSPYKYPKWPSPKS